MVRHRSPCTVRRFRPRLELLEDRTLPSSASTTALLVSPAASSVFAQPVQLTADVSGHAGTPTGSVFFVADSSTFLGSATLSGGSASIDTTTLAVGSHSLTAVYLGSSVYGGSTSSAVAPFEVNPSLLSTTALSFGSVAVGSTSALTVALTDGTGLTTLTAVGITGPNAADFTLGSGPSLPFGLSNAPVTYTVTWQPSQAGPESVTLTFATSAGPQVVQLSGTGVAVPKAPTANAGGSYFMVPETALTLDASASASTDAASDNLTYSWTINGHAAAATGVQPTLSWAQLTALGIGLGSNGNPANFSVSVQVTDSTGNTATSSSVNLEVAIPSAGVFATPGFPDSGATGEASSVTLVGIDKVPANQAAGFTFVIDWGDGTQQTVSGPTLTTATHVYNTTGEQSVSVTAIDQQGAASLPIIIATPINILLNPSAHVVDLMTTPHQVISDALPAGAVTPSTVSKTYQVDLNQGDFLAVTVTPAAGILTAPLKASTLVVTAPDGTQQTSGGKTDPVFGFTATQTGTYTLELSSPSQFLHGLAYTLDLHRLALAQGTQSPTALQQSGSMFAFLAGNALDITGPTGYGFSITGTWTQMVKIDTVAVPAGGISLSHSIYTATGTLTVNTAVGGVPLPVLGKFVVTTAANPFGAEFGIVSSIQNNFNFSLANYVSKFTNAVGEFGLKVNTARLLSVGWSIEMGSQIQQQQQIKQVLGGVPYLFYNAQAGLSADLRQHLHLGAAAQGVEHQDDNRRRSNRPLVVSGAAVASAGDFAAGAVGQRSHPLCAQVRADGRHRLDRHHHRHQWRFGKRRHRQSRQRLSGRQHVRCHGQSSRRRRRCDRRHNQLGRRAHLGGTHRHKGAGYVAATGLATTTLAQGLTQFFGQVFVNASVPFVIAGLPLSVSGDVTMNLDVNNTGQFLDGRANAGQLFSGVLADASTILHDVDIGVNGTLNVGYTGNGFKLALPLGGASAVYNGPLGGVWLRTVGGTNPLAGTPFSFLSYGATDSVEGAIFDNGQFFLTLAGTTNIAPFSVQVALTLDTNGVTATGSTGFKLEATSGAEITGDLTLTLSVDDVSGKLEWSGSATASYTVKFLGVTSSHSITVTVNNNEIVVNLGFGITITIPLP